MLLTPCLVLGAATTMTIDAAQAADGCTPGTFSSVQSPDGNATSVLFDDFSATGGGSSGRTRGVTTCKLSAPVTRTDGYSVYSVDYRGFVSTEEGQTASIVTTKDGQTVLDHQITGPLQDNIEVGNKVGVSGSGTLDLSVTLTASGPLSDVDPEAGLFLDSVDLARLGFTTTASVQNSADQIARQKQFIATELMGTAQDMLGQFERFDRGSYIAAFGSSEAAGGFTARWEANDAITVMGGAAIVNPNGTDVPIDTMALFAGAVRYTTPQAPWRAFAEAGLWGSPDVEASFTRSYVNIDQLVLAGGTASGSLFSAYGRAGAIYAPDAANELALSVRYTRSWLDMDGYSETRTNQNLFGATVAGSRSDTDTVSAEFAWSHATEGPLDYTVMAAAGRTFGSKDAAKLAVDWAGTVSGRSEKTDFATLGGRLGWKLDDQWKINGTIAANFREDTDPSVTFGASLQAQF